MKCQKVQEVLWLYKIGEIDAGLSSAVQSHLQGCSACSKEISLLEEVIQHLPATPALSDTYWESYTEEILNGLKLQRLGVPVYLWRWVPVAAMALIFMTGAWVYQVQQKKKIEKIIADLDLLENLDVVEREDFDQFLSGEIK
jgi:hypothetical protein